MIGRLMNMNELVEWELAEETKVLGKSLPQCNFIHHKSHMIWHVIEVPTRSSNQASSASSKEARCTRPRFMTWEIYNSCRPIIVSIFIEIQGKIVSDYTACNGTIPATIDIHINDKWTSKPMRYAKLQTMYLKNVCVPLEHIVPPFLLFLITSVLRNLILR
jgi:hypothetical protein